MTVSSWVAALRLARRDVSRHRGRSALVVALIGVPVLLLGIADIGYNTYELSPQEKLTREIGAADAGLQWAGAPDVQQGSSAWLGDFSITGHPRGRPPATATVAALLPQGSRLIEQRIDADPLVFRTHAGLEQAELSGLDYRDPIAAGLVTQRSGHAPRNAGQVVLTTALAAATGLRVGQQVRELDSHRSLRIVGTVADTHNQQDKALYSVPSAVPLSTVSSGLDYSGTSGLTWLVDTPRPVTWAATARADQAGLLVLSRSVYLHPGTAARAATARITSTGTDSTTIAVLVLVAGMALLEVVLLAGPAFAVGAKRRRRDLALVAAGGGSPRDVRRVVLAGGIVLGALAGILGVGSAVALSLLGLPLLRGHVARLPGHVDVRALDLLVLAGAGLLAAVLSSIAPALAAGRTPIVAALSGRPTPSRIRARVPLVAVLLAVVGVLVAVAGSTRGGNEAALAILAGTTLLELAVIVTTPVVLVLAARSGRRLPLAPRIALRDAGRNRSAATPAVAAVMASVVGATAILIGLTSIADRDRREYQPSLPRLTATADVPPSATGARAVVHDLAATLPTSSAAVLDVPSTDCRRSNGRCRLVDLRPADDVFSYGILPNLVVDHGAATTVLFGARATQADAALARGQVVVARPSLVRDGTVRLVTEQAMVRAGHDLETGSVHAVRLPAVTIPFDGSPNVLVVVPSTVARRLGVQTTPFTALVRLTRMPSATERQAALGRLHAELAAPAVVVETGYHDPYAALTTALVVAAIVIAVLAAVIATGLANVDARPDLVTLAAVGAAPRIRRSLAAVRAGVIAVLGTVIGVAAGFLAPAAYVYGSHDLGAQVHFVVPWSGVLGVAVVVPTLATALAGAITRGRLPIE